MGFLIALSFPAVMIVAAVSDLRTMTIPNWLVIVLGALFPAFAVTVGIPASMIAFHLATGMAVLFATFGLFAAGWMGGGDAKLIAAAALWLGPSAMLMSFMLWTSILGGCLTLAFLLARACLSPTTGWSSVDRLLNRHSGIPYGVAIGAAGVLTTPDLLSAFSV